MHCTNLFEIVCNALATQATPAAAAARAPGDSHADDGEPPPVELNILNRLALEGLLAVVDSIAKRCHDRPRPLRLPAAAGGLGAPPASEGAESESTFGGTDSLTSGGASDASADDLPHPPRGGGHADFLSAARERTALVLQQRKRQKRRLGLAAECFNNDERGKKWLAYASELGLATEGDAASVAAFLRGTPGLDKAKIGEYIAKGPAEKYPFHQAVLSAYVLTFDFAKPPAPGGGPAEWTFDGALRSFLSAFRLPGESQCIDRLMEAFAQGLHAAHGGSASLPFKTPDAGFVLAFSTIMLNTDLHNPNMDDAKRMKVGDFVRNNRGIDGGDDLPRPFLEGLYASIRDDEIRLGGGDVKDLGDAAAGEVSAAVSGGASRSSNSAAAAQRRWDGLLERADRVTAAAFTKGGAAGTAALPAGVHENSMFSSIAPAVAAALRVMVR